MVNIVAVFWLATTVQPHQDDLVKPEATIKEELGFLRAIFTSAKGTITVILPSDIAQGDTISGTYFTDEKAKDVTGIQIDLGDAHGPPPEIINSPRRKWEIPSSAGPRLSLTVWTTDGVSFGTTYVSVGTKKAKPAQFNIPNFARIAAPLLIPGPLDGDAENTKMSVAGVNCPVVAESPRGAVALIPSAMKMGESLVELQEQKMKAEAFTRMLSVLISSPKTTLSLGEPSGVTLKVDGLAGVSATKLPMVILENLTPKVVDLEGRVKHYIVTKPEEDGTFSKTLSLTRIAAGKFAVSATVDPGPGTKVSPKAID
jgi:hypothetical protein